MATNEAKQIREALKAAGIKARSVSVRARHGITVDVRIKDPGVSLRKVEAIAKGYESISRCEYSGEILSGGNTFVSVGYAGEAAKVAEQVERYLDGLPATVCAFEIVPGLRVSGDDGDRRMVALVDENGTGSFYGVHHVAAEILSAAAEQGVKPRFRLY